MVQKSVLWFKKGKKTWPHTPQKRETVVSQAEPQNPKSAKPKEFPLRAATNIISQTNKNCGLINSLHSRLNKYWNKNSSISFFSFFVTFFFFFLFIIQWFSFVSFCFSIVLRWTKFLRGDLVSVNRHLQDCHQCFSVNVSWF